MSFHKVLMWRWKVPTSAPDCRRLGHRINNRDPLAATRAPGRFRRSGVAACLGGSVSWFECVPNFSEGRDEARIAKIVAEAQGVPGVTLLDVEQNADHNRCVVTLVGEGPALVDVVLRMMRVRHDSHRPHEPPGEHPRMGATDVVPFVPLGEATTEEAINLAVALGIRVWEELQIPVYLYGQAARVTERQDLAKVHAGQFEAIRDAIGTDPARHPDIGEPKRIPRGRGGDRRSTGAHRLQRLPHNW